MLKLYGCSCLTSLPERLGECQQLKKLDTWIERRHQIAVQYDEAFRDDDGIMPLGRVAETRHGWHLYVVRLKHQPRDSVFRLLRTAGIGVNVHYIPVHLHPFYRRHLPAGPGLCPNAEAAYEEILSLPVHPGMTDEQVSFVTGQLKHAAIQSRRAA